MEKVEVFYSDAGLWTLLVAAFILATTHSMSPDHWFPFVMVGRAQQSKISQVLVLACLAGIGHVGTSVIIGLLGVFAKTGTSKEIAAFLENATPVLLMIFGFSYAAYAFYQRVMGGHGHSHGIPIINRWLGIDPHSYDFSHHEHHHHDREITQKRGLRFGSANLYLHNMDIHIRVDHADHHHHYDASRERNHSHEHEHGYLVHNHAHLHQVSEFHTHNDDEHANYISEANIRNKKAAWGLVAILGLTPCIALVPLTFAAVKYGTMGVIMVNVVFAAATIGTIVLLTWLGLVGISWIKLDFFDKHGDIIAGVIIGLLGVMTKVLEL